MRKSFRKIKKRIKNWLIYVAVKSGILWMLSVQRSTAMKLLQTISSLGFYIIPAEREKTIKNLTKVFGESKSRNEINKMAKQVFSNLGRNMADAFAVPRFTKNNIDFSISLTAIPI